jgi:signal transduction histidine kinase
MGVKKDIREGHFRFNVLNEGPGFTEEEAKGLFTKFSRFRAENFGTKSGTGVGLFVTKGIVEKHGGKIWAESDPGKYANFIFTIPAKPAQ